MKGFYFDENVSRDIARALLKKDVPVVLAADVGMRMKDDDAEHLPYATERELVLVTFDHPFASRTDRRNDFYCLVCLSHSIKRDIGDIIEILYEFWLLFDDEQDTGKVYYFP